MNKIYEDITIVTVLYNSAQINEIFFENIKNFKTIVVDNGKNEEILDEIKRHLKKIGKSLCYLISAISFCKHNKLKNLKQL